MSQSPAKPWKPGKHPEYTAIRIQVNICQDEFGNVWSDHEYLTPEDEAVAQGMEHGAIPQVAHALLTEAVRREAFQTVLLQMTQDPDFLMRWATTHEKDREGMELILDLAIRDVISKTLKKMVPGALRGVLMMLRDQAKGLTTPSERV